MKKKLMSQYLFQDIFSRFRTFFKTDKLEESKFLYDVSFGFMPRFFDPRNDFDHMLFIEEDDIPEMYFCLEGKIGIGYSFSGRKYTNKQCKIAKYFKRYFLMCDHYVLNNKRCEFIYQVLEPVKSFALSRKFLHKEIAPKYPEIFSEMKSEAYIRYKNYLKTPIVEHMHREIESQNKKSVYRIVKLKDKEEFLKKFNSDDLDDFRLP